MRLIDTPANIAAASAGVTPFSASVNKGTFISYVITQTYPFTIACWIKLEKDVKSSAFPKNIFNLADAAQTTWLSVQYVRTGGGVGVVTSAPTSNFYKTIEFGNWHHICLSAASTTSRLLYLDGARIGNLTASFAFTNISDIYIGYDVLSTYGTEGIQLADFAISDIAFNPTQVHALANGESIGLKNLKYFQSMQRPFSARTPPGSGNNGIDGWNVSGLSDPNIQAQNAYEYPIKTRPMSIFGGISGRRRLFVVS